MYDPLSKSKIRHPGKVPHHLFEAITRHSRFVGITKHALVLFALLITLAVVYISLHNASDSRFRLVFSSIETGEDSVPQMINPRFHGLDKEDNPYNLTASIATQLDDNTVELEKINADLTMKNGTWLSLMAPKGTYLIAEKHLSFADGVQLFHDNGYEMRADSAEVDIEAGTVQSTAPVEMQGPLGVLKAIGFTMQKEGQYIRFDKQVEMTLYPRGK